MSAEVDLKLLESRLRVAEFAYAALFLAKKFTNSEAIPERISADAAAMAEYFSTLVATPIAEETVEAEAALLTATPDQCFAVSTDDVTSGTGGATSAQLLLQNPISSNKALRLKTLTMSTCVSSNNNIFRIYLNPVIQTLGTALSIRSCHIKDGAPVSLMQAYLAPKFSQNGSFFLNFIAGATSSLIFNPTLPIVIRPGHSLGVLVRPNAANTTFSLNALWEEI